MPTRKDITTANKITIEMPEKKTQYSKLEEIAEHQWITIEETFSRALKIFSDQGNITRGNLYTVFLTAHNVTMKQYYKSPLGKKTVDDLEESFKLHPLYPDFDKAIINRPDLDEIANTNLWGNKNVNLKMHIWMEDAVRFVEWFIQVYKTLYMKNNIEPTTEQIKKWILPWLKNLAFISNWMFGNMWVRLSKSNFDVEYFVLDDNNILQPSQKLVAISNLQPHTQEAVWCPYMKAKWYADFFWKWVVGMYIKYSK